MKTSELNFAHLLTLLILFSFSALNAQSYTADALKWGEHPEDFITQQKVLELEGITLQQQKNLEQIKAIYMAFSKGDIATITAKLASEISWNGQADFPLSDGNPYIGRDILLEAAFDKLGEGWTNWKLEDVVFDKQLDHIITVSGRYQATRQNATTDSQFLHMWTWKNGSIIKFQHYETVQAMAKR